MATRNADDESSVVESTDEDGADDEGVQLSVLLSGVGRLLLPVVLLLLAANYVNVTWGRIRWANLRYPYFIIGVMSVFLLWVAFDELRELYRMDRERTTARALRAYVEAWRPSIAFAGILIAYAAAIQVLGFFTASFLAMVSIMYAAEVRDYRTGLLVTVGILALVWATFVEFVGVNPPDGMIDSLFR